MKKILLFLSVLVFTACGGGDGGGGGSSKADYYYRSGQSMPAVFSLSGPPSGWNPVYDMDTEDFYRETEVVNVDAYANGVQATALMTVNHGHLTGTILTVLSSLLDPVSGLFEGKCSMPNIKVAFFEFVTRDDGLGIIKVGTRGETVIFYSYLYSDGSANINCNYTDSDGDIVDVKLSLKSGWNEIRTSSVDISSITAEEEFWVINFE